MRPFLQTFSRQTVQYSRQAYSHKRTLSATTAMLSSMVAYSATVTKQNSGPVPDDADAKPHHVRDSHGKVMKFTNPHPSYVAPRLRDIFGVVWKTKVTGEIVAPKPTGKEITVVTAEFLPSRESSGTLRATWLGHACYYVEYPSGLRVLFDPVFEDHCSPFSFMGFKRYSQPPCNISTLPYVDAVVISHSHYDHLSYPTVQEIKRHHPEAHYFVGSGLETWFKKSGITKVTEMDWWEDAELTLTPSSSKAAADDASTKSQQSIRASISCLPSQHSSGRSGFDRDHTLWASWAISSGGKSVWFGGDTGYRQVPKLPKEVDDYGADYKDLPVCPHFKQIGELRGPFDLGLIPIGAYDPREVFSSLHANPFDSVNIFKETKCKRAMGIHWGTWVLTPEDVLEPPQLLKEALKRNGLLETGVFDVCNVGESREF